MTDGSSDEAEPVAGPATASLGSRRLLTDAVLIASAPAAGYVVAWIYQYGYAQRLAIPIEFIEVRAQNVLIATLSLAGIALFLAQPISLVWPLASRGSWSSRITPHIGG